MIFPKLNLNKISGAQLFIIGIVGALITVSSGLLGFKFIPDYIYKKIWETKILKENTMAWDTFLKTPLPFEFRVFLFNISNPDDVMNGMKPVVKETGPYVYKLNRWKEAVSWNYDTKEISYYEYEFYEFDQNRSGSFRESDVVTVLNLPYNSLLSLAQSISEDFLPVLDTSLPNIFGVNDGLFLTTSVKNFLFDGIRFCRNASQSDDFTTRAVCGQVKRQTSQAKQMKIDGEDVLYATLDYRNNTHQGYFTVKSGQENKHEAATLVRFENVTYLSVWDGGNSTCNKIRGVTAVFPANIEKNMTFDTFSEDICRAIKLNYSGIQYIKNVEGYKFGSVDAFRRSDANQCFCLNKTMDLDGEYRCFDGFLDLTSCQGAPALVSFPHFLYADEKYIQGVRGIKPNKTLHETYIVLEPMSGIPLALAKRVQFNMFIRPLEGISRLENVTPALVPIFWIEESMTLSGSYFDLLKYTLLRSFFILKIVRWILLAIGLSIVLFSVFLFLNFK
ncbi:sensory neuron membrane protein 2-like [Sitophilus oryzae]|uniref:Sensory neuron membrane protein 2 n=1 Tax=Sitophilus oryzae TaxID=7048 RepID=A0A6J2XSG4_SITOR|nr:sensory neuron membrane protein 2-like [Sitophilus oryzae]